MKWKSHEFFYIILKIETEMLLLGLKNMMKNIFLDESLHN